MNSTEIQARINILKEELETRHKTGIVKMAAEDGTPISVEKLQEELYSLVYKLSKIE